MDFFSLNMAKHMYRLGACGKSLIPYGESAEMYDLIRLIMSETARARTDILPVLRGMVYALLSQHGRYRSRHPLPSTDVNLLNLEDIIPALEYINRNYASDITVDMLAKICNTSRASLQRKFLNVTGLASIQYVHQLRIRRAEAMLHQNKASVVQISMGVGYNSLSSFNRNFLRINGVPPSVWRKRMGPSPAERQDP
jgi:AraC-like DNA-binding protein